MGRLIDIDRLCDDLAKRWSIADKKKEDTIRAVMADVVTPIVVSQPTVDAVPREIEQANKQAAYVRGYEDGQKDKYGRWGDSVEVRRGRWIPCHPLGDNAPEGYMCSVCHVGGWAQTKFCPNCGARNTEGDDET